MPKRIALRCALLVVVLILTPVFPGGAVAQIDTWEFSGRLSIESRWYPKTGAYSGQRSHSSGVVAEPRLFVEDAGGRSFTLPPGPYLSREFRPVAFPAYCGQ